MKTSVRSLITIALIAVPLLSQAASAPITRRDGFLLIWNSIRRPVLSSSEKPFADVPRAAHGEAEITYAKYRGLIDDAEENFRPDEPLTVDQALLWIYRTRSVDFEDLYPREDMSGGSDLYGVARLTRTMGLERYIIHHPESEYVINRDPIGEEDLLSAMRFIDAYLLDEAHEVSLYSEKFHGKGTAFGEPFDMYAMTAAHRTFPANTLVEVTNLDNGKSVIVRINDRGPFVEGRDMDLSLGAFTTIAERSKGKIMARFRRLGDATLVGFCNGSPYAVRLGRTARLSPGFPFALPLGQSLSVGGNDAFVVHSVRYPDGNVTWVEDWVLKGERYRITPSVTGTYIFRVSSKTGSTRDFEMHVASCAI